MKEDSLVEKVLYKLVKKHISGTTMNSALDKAKELNQKDVLASLTFLCNNVEDKPKAKYATTTYLELIRQVARLNINANVQVPLNQLGSGISEGILEDNLKRVLDAGNKNGVFIWFEVDGVSRKMLRSISESKGCGIAANADEAKEIIASNVDVKALKLMFNEKRGKEDVKESEYNYMDGFMDARSNIDNVVILSPPEKVVKKLIKGRGGAKNKRSVVFEFQLGYSRKLQKRAIKRGVKTSVYVPFGKDWVNYAVNNVPEGYMRFLAGRLLKGEVEGGV